MRKSRVRRRQEGFHWAVQRQKTDRSGSPYRLFDSIKPTYSISLCALRHPIPRIHARRMKERERAYRGNPSVIPTKFVPISIQPRPELSSLFVKINLWLPLMIASLSAKSGLKCREAPPSFYLTLIQSLILFHAKLIKYVIIAMTIGNGFLQIIHSRFVNEK